MSTREAARRGLGDPEDIRKLRSDIDRLQFSARRGVSDDLVIDVDRGFYLRAPGGNYWRVTITDAGVLTTTLVGASL